MTKKKGKKKTTAKPATAEATALPNSSDIPEGMKEIGGGYAPTWKPENPGDTVSGPVVGSVREVELTIGRKKQTRRCMEVESAKGVTVTVWESATLGELFDEVAERGEGVTVYIRFEGFGKKKSGQNPPKLFKTAIST